MLAEKLYKLRKDRGLSQEKLAEQLNVSRQAISKWESGVAVPELEKLIVISNYFGVSVDYLLKEDEEMTGIVVGNNDCSNTKKMVGLIICIAGIVAMIIWGALSIFRPEISNQMGLSYTITIDGNGLFWFVCVIAVAIGAGLLLKSKK